MKKMLLRAMRAAKDTVASYRRSHIQCVLASSLPKRSAMSRIPTIAFIAVLTTTSAFGQISCLNTFTTPPGQTMVPNPSWTAVNVPLGTTTNLNVTTTAGSTVATVTGATPALLCAMMTGPGFPGGTTVVSVSGSSVWFSNPATTTGSAIHSFTVLGYANNYPPQNPGCLSCLVCPAIFTAPICAGEYFTYHMCEGNAYTISMCGSTTSWDSYLHITDEAGTASAPGATTGSTDGCGVVDGHASLTYIPTATGTYRVRLWLDPCTVSPADCGTISVACNVIPVGIAETQRDAITLSIQPNPASDQLTVFAPFTGEVEWRIVDMAGRSVMQDRTQWMDRATIGIASLAQGTYVLKVMDAHGSSASAFFEKR